MIENNKWVGKIVYQCAFSYPEGRPGEVSIFETDTVEGTVYVTDIHDYRLVDLVDDDGKKLNQFELRAWLKDQCKSSLRTDILEDLIQKVEAKPKTIWAVYKAWSQAESVETNEVSDSFSTFEQAKSHLMDLFDNEPEDLWNRNGPNTVSIVCSDNFALHKGDYGNLGQLYFEVKNPNHSHTWERKLQLRRFKK